MSSVVRNGETRLYEALFQLAQSISGHDDLQGLCRGLATSLKPVIDVDYLGLALYDQPQHLLRLHAITGISVDLNHAIMSAAADDNPAGWVWQNQQPVVIPDLALECRWSDFVSKVRGSDCDALMMFPLTSGSRRLGVLAFGKQNSYEPGDAELAFLSRVASESAVTLDAHLMQQELRRQRDRLQVLLSITNAFVSKLAPDQLFSAMSSELQKLLDHDVAAITLCNESGQLELHAFRFIGDAQYEVPQEPVSPEGLPSGEALRTGKPVVVQESDWVRFPSPILQQWRDAGLKSACCVPLITKKGAIGTLELARRSEHAFTEDEVNLCVQVAGQVAIVVENALAYRELARMKEKLATEKLYLEAEIRFDQNLTNMIGDSPAFRALLKSAQVVAPTDATVLVLGETGTGKELIARAIHDMSGRSARSFVKVNCPAIPATLLESELFGHEKGAFTGASGQKIGRFELADHGTLFLDEVGEIPLELQSKLLRAIQEQEFERLGGNRTIRVDIRVIAATNRNLKAMVEEGKFRSDLYYRLHVFPLEVPPLRERKPDIPLLVRYFAQKYAQRMNRKIDSIPAAALEELSNYEWPGNIRELQNVIERSVIVTQGPVLQVSTQEFRSVSGVLPVRCSRLSTDERATIVLALRESNGVVGGPNGAAARLGLKRTTLQSRMRKLKIGKEYR
ncbi:MAG: sigma 54-interacting transcriptional regulator [Bryobacterales bacterium]|nr:sigma 54-interacting transcriptional regulator [Bryobacterales bacterium]